MLASPLSSSSSYWLQCVIAGGSSRRPGLCKPIARRCRRCQSGMTSMTPSSSSQCSEEPPFVASNLRPRTNARVGVSQQKDDSVVRNQVGVQLLSPHLQSQLFGKVLSKGRLSPERIRIAREHLRSHGLFNTVSKAVEPIKFDLPPLHGNLDEHFWRISSDQAEPYLSLAKLLASIELPPMPTEWAVHSGWVRYEAGGTWTSIDHPSEPILTFDVETMYKESPYAVMATAASENAWYGWISPWLLGESEIREQLIPMGDATRPRVIVGHNVGFDRARIAEEYSIYGTANRFIDTMSLHVATNGITSSQRPLWHLHQKRDRDIGENQSSGAPSAQSQLWQDISSINNLRDVAKLHVDIEIEKETRNLFAEYTKDQMVENIQGLMKYCATDVWVTHLIYCNLLDKFLQLCPHPASFAGQLTMGSAFLTVDEGWPEYIERSERKFRELSDAVTAKLESLARETAKLLGKPEVYNEDPWLRQLDWTKCVDRPKWFSDIYKVRSDKVKISTRSKVAPLLLKVTWRGYPLYHSRQHGWCYGVPKARVEQLIEDREIVPEVSLPQISFADSADHRLEALQKEEGAGVEGPLVYFKLPHKDGNDLNVGSPFSKSYIPAFEDGTLHSSFSEARNAIEMNSACSYWISTRERIRDQFVVWDNQGADTSPMSLGIRKKTTGIILPPVITMGTVTRRAVENTWLTASNAKANRVGSELKAMVKAPPGYKIVGADVDSEELWISSVMGDAQLGMHGATAIGWMTLEGSKSQGTDLHSKTAQILGISRDNAKIFNYARIYGAGQKYAAQLLLKFNPGLREAEAKAKAKELYRQTKGTKFANEASFGRRFWHGGSESYVFNVLESIALSDEPRTPSLGCGITQALTKKYLKDDSNAFMTSRVNWVVQSSGVDYLHLVLVGMGYLSRRYDIDARFMLSVHDEVRFLVKEEDAMRAALALQVVNLWTRAFFSHRLGLSDLPQSCAFFSAVDINHVLRKEADLTCVTPSHPDPIAPGKSINISEILRATNGKLVKASQGFNNTTDSTTLGMLIDAIPVPKEFPSAHHKLKPTSLLWLEAQAATEASHIRSLASLNVSHVDPSVHAYGKGGKSYSCWGTVGSRKRRG